MFCWFVFLLRLCRPQKQPFRVLIRKKRPFKKRHKHLISMSSKRNQLMWLHKLDIASVSHSMTRIDGQQSSAKMPHLNVINLNEFIKNEWKCDAENEKQLGKQKDCRYKTCAPIKSQEKKTTDLSSMPTKIIDLGLTSC